MSGDEGIQALMEKQARRIRKLEQAVNLHTKALAEKNLEFQTLKAKSDEQDLCVTLQNELKLTNEKLADVVKICSNLLSGQRVNTLAHDKKQVRDLRTRGNAHFMQGEYDKAIECCTEAIEIEKSGRNDTVALANLMFNQGHCYHQIEKYDTAIQQYTSAIELQPEDTDFYKARADIYFELERNAEALQDVRTILALKPNNKEAMKLLKQIKNETKLGR